MTDRTANSFGASAYGGPGWAARTASHSDEMGALWLGGVDSEWRSLSHVLLAEPTSAVADADPEASQYLAPVDLSRARAEHDLMAEAYRAAGVTVDYVTGATSPNAMFCADLFAMTPQGAILARPASTVRAGEEVSVAHALARLRVPILATLTGDATFEGADMLWLDAQTALIGRGLRTNQDAIDQIRHLLERLGVEAIAADMPFGTMHLMGMLRIVDRDLAIAWPRRTPHAAVVALRERGFQVAFLPDEDEAAANRGLNIVTLGPRRVLMPGGNPVMRGFYEGLGVEVIETPMNELRKAAGAVGCLTGIVAREMGG
ncbi:MAG: arginine deiminase family protein [Pseudomonadota bacterium]